MYDLGTYSATYHCLEAVTLYELDISSFIRLIIKKNPETFETMQRFTASKIRFRHASIKEGIPLYAALLESKTNQQREQLGKPKFLPKLLVLQQKRRLQRERILNASKQEDRGKAGIRLQKVRLLLLLYGTSFTNKLITAIP